MINLIIQQEADCTVVDIYFAKTMDQNYGDLKWNNVVKQLKDIEIKSHL